MAKRRSTVEKGFLNLLDSGKLPANWKSEYDADLALGCLIASMKDGILPFMVATRFQYRNWLAIDARRDDIISVSNDSKTVWELLELFLFEKIKRNSETLPFTFDKMVSHAKVVPQITNHIADIVEKYGNRWSEPIIFDAMAALVSDYDKKQHGSVSTSLDLVKEILDQIPDDAFNGTVLDPVCGNGPFLYQAKEIMLDNGATEEEALNRIAGIDIDPKKVYITNALLNPTGKYKTNLCVGNSLQLETKMKFDVIVGNPPFQYSAGDTSRKLYVDLTTRIIDNNLADGGFIGFVTPRAVMIPGQKNKVGTIFSKYNLQTVLFNADNYFSVGQDICAWILKKAQNQYNQSVKVVHKDNTKDTQNFPNIYDNSNVICFSIIEKLIHLDDKSNKAPIGQSNQGRGVHPSQIFNTNKPGSTEVYCNTKKQRIKYTFNPVKGITPRLVIPYCGGYLEKDQIFISDTQTNEQFFVSLSIQGSQLENLKAYMESKLVSYVVVNHQTRYRPSVAYNMLFSLAAPDLSKAWSDDELYKHFGINAEEQKEVEEWWKKNKR